MKRRYRKPAPASSRPEVQWVERPELADGRVAIELPVSVAAAIQGVTAEIEQLTGQAGLLIMQAVMEAEIEQLAGPRASTSWSARSVAGGANRALPWGARGAAAASRARARRIARFRSRLARFQSPPRRQGSIVRQLIHGSAPASTSGPRELHRGYGISRAR